MKLSLSISSLQHYAVTHGNKKIAELNIARVQIIYLKGELYLLFTKLHNLLITITY
jgi:hypothetical protein